MDIRKYRFETGELDRIKKSQYGTNWPVVYIINNDDEAYIGETLDASKRTFQHLQNPDRMDLDTIHFISDETFNKSVILDLESFLIRYMSSDELFKLQNSNSGVCNHNYFDRDKYEKNFQNIWNELKKEKLVRNSLTDIENSDIFKYSPYKALTDEQADALARILKLIEESKNNTEKTLIKVNGGAGTGKTILAVYLMKLLTEVNSEMEYFDADEVEPMQLFADQIGNIKVALVIPMQSLRKTIQRVFKNIKGLSPDMVISPNEVPNDRYDLLIVDEAHRLRRRKALAQYPAFDKNNAKLGLDKSGTELDWIIKCSRMQVLFYDPLQSVKPADVDPAYFEEVFAGYDNRCDLFLTSQLRCMGGSDYVNYISSILHCSCGVQKKFAGYDLRLFDDVGKMVEAIKVKDRQEGLCRVVAGFAWKWKTKDKKALAAGEHDIDICGHKYVWNTTAIDWINSPNAINEIGCIHTVQGYDLNYAGVIFGNEIRYDPVSKTIMIDKKSYCDQIGKTALKNDDELRDYIINIYLTLMTRGIKGTYVYVCDKGLREYLSKFIRLS